MEHRRIVATQLNWLRFHTCCHVQAGDQVGWVGLQAEEKEENGDEQVEQRAEDLAGTICDDVLYDYPSHSQPGLPEL